MKTQRNAAVIVLQPGKPPYYLMYNNIPFPVAKQRKKELIARGYAADKVKVTYCK